MLIPCDRHTAADLRHWRMLEAADALRCQRERRRLERWTADAMDAIEAFAEAGTCYAGLSCGKDSVLLAWILRCCAEERGVYVPLVYVHVDPHANPHNGLVLDALRERGITAETITVRCERDASGAWLGTGRLEAGFALAAERYGDRYISGVRADESYARRMRLAGHGVSTARTCAPLSRWTTADVFAASHRWRLPLHPAYAMTAGGRFPREHLRVATIGGARGTDRGRREHEMLYYRAELEALGLDSRAV